MGLGYVLCSSMMMVVNKLALRAFPYPSSLMALQFLVSAVVVRGLGVLGQLECAPLERERVRAFWIVPLVFEVAIAEALTKLPLFVSVALRDSPVSAMSRSYSPSL